MEENKGDILNKEFEKQLKEVFMLMLESLIREIERTGRTYVTTTELRKFIQNIETNTKVTGKKYIDEVGK